MQPQSNAGGWLRTRTGIGFLVFLAIAAFYLLTEHTAHVFGALPWLLFALCPLMHLFMHGGHGGHGGDRAGHDAGQAPQDGGGRR